ncbi:MAG: acetylglutamate kinase [Spirochaetota bacterium]
MEKETVTIKIGGKAASEEAAFDALAAEMAGFKGKYSFILVHGGGDEVTKIAKLFGIEPVFKDGIRITSAKEMEIVDMVLAGRLNKYLVRRFNRTGRAVGLSGSDGAIFTGTCLEDGLSTGSRTGRITTVDTHLLHLLVSADYVPIIASTSMDEHGDALNINADEAAFAIASEIPAGCLVFISDIPGILKEGKIIAAINEKNIQAAIQSGIISGGMIPKVRSSVNALKKGVTSVIIGQYQKSGDLAKLLAGRGGSRITL